MKLFVLILVTFFSTKTFSRSQSVNYLVYLKSNSILTRLTDKRAFTITEGIYAKVSEIDLTRERFLVYSKEGVPIYETVASSIVEIDEDVRLLPRYQGDVSYPPPENFEANDLHNFFDSQFNIHYDNLLTSEFNSVYNDQLKSVMASRVIAQRLCPILISRRLCPIQ